MAAQVNTPYPTAILVREKAMVINLESIRMIICKDQVLFSDETAVLCCQAAPRSCMSGHLATSAS